MSSTEEYDAAQEPPLTEDARRRAHEIGTAADDAARRAAEEDTQPSRDDQIAEVRRSGRHYEIDQEAADHPRRGSRRDGPRR